MITIEKLKKSYKQGNTENLVFDNLDFKIKKGSFIAIIGRSGSGKTSLLNMIAGLQSFDSGEIHLGKEKYSEKTNDELTKFRGENLSFIFQQFHLIPNLSVTENIELPLQINKLKARFSTKDVLEKVGLSEKADSYPFELSGGEQQRVAIARAFIGDTSLLLADEPTGNLDAENAENIMKILKELHSEANNTVILITHDLKVAKYADKIFELKNKQLQLNK